MTRRQTFITAILAGVLVGTVLEPSLGRAAAIVIAVAVAAAIDAGGRRIGARRRHDGDRSRRRSRRP